MVKVMKTPQQIEHSRIFRDTALRVGIKPKQESGDAYANLVNRVSDMMRRENLESQPSTQETSSEAIGIHCPTCEAGTLSAISSQ